MATKRVSTTKARESRENEIERHASNTIDDGRYGRVFELECARASSRKCRVSKQGEADVYIKYGKGYVKAECKTNGGRIESLLNGNNTAKFVIYRLDFTQKHKACKSKPAWEEVRHIEPVIIPTELFIKALRKFGAIKSTNGVNPELAIQPSSKKWYEWLKDYPVEYHNDWDYEASDFEGLTV